MASIHYDGFIGYGCRSWKVGKHHRKMLWYPPTDYCDDVLFCSSRWVWKTSPGARSCNSHGSEIQTSLRVPKIAPDLVVLSATSWCFACLSSASNTLLHKNHICSRNVENPYNSHDIFQKTHSNIRPLKLCNHWSLIIQIYTGLLVNPTKTILYLDMPSNSLTILYTFQIWTGLAYNPKQSIPYLDVSSNSFTILYTFQI